MVQIFREKILEVDENNMSSDKSFEERMKLWAEKHSVTPETVDEILKRRSLDSTADFFADCDPASIDVIDESECNVQEGK